MSIFKKLKSLFSSKRKKTTNNNDIYKQFINLPEEQRNILLEFAKLEFECYKKDKSRNAKKLADIYCEQNDLLKQSNLTENQSLFYCNVINNLAKSWNELNEEERKYFEKYCNLQNMANADRFVDEYYIHQALTTQYNRHKQSWKEEKSENFKYIEKNLAFFSQIAPNFNELKQNFSFLRINIPNLNELTCFDLKTLGIRTLDCDVETTSLNSALNKRKKYNPEIEDIISPMI